MNQPSREAMAGKLQIYADGNGGRAKGWLEVPLWPL
jgi:hypothetical protein